MGQGGGERGGGGSEAAKRKEKKRETERDLDNPSGEMGADVDKKRGENEKRD